MYESDCLSLQWPKRETKHVKNAKSDESESVTKWFFIKASIFYERSRASIIRRRYDDDVVFMGPAQAIASRLSWCGIQYLIGQRAYGCCVWGWSLISAKLQDSKDLLGCCNLSLSLSLFQEREYTRSTRYWSFDGLKPWVTSLSTFLLYPLIVSLVISPSPLPPCLHTSSHSITKMIDIIKTDQRVGSTLLSTHVCIHRWIDQYYAHRPRKYIN